MSLGAIDLVFIYPLWLGDMPALLKAFLEQVLRPQFAFRHDGNRMDGGLKGRSARIVVTTGMPGWIYRSYYGAHSLRSFKYNIRHFVGIRQVAQLSWDASTNRIFTANAIWPG